MDNLQLVKTVKLTRVENLLVQIPKHIVEGWQLKKGDSLKMYLNEQGQIVIIPQEGYIIVRPVNKDVPLRG